MERNVVSATSDQGSRVARANAAGRWRLDPARSTVGFSVKKFWGMATVRGTFTDVTGHVDVESDGSIEAVLEIAAGSVDTGNAKRDEHLRGNDFFAAADFPQLRVVVDEVSLTEVDRGRAAGWITILGETRPVGFDARIDVGSVGDVAAVRAELVVDRSAFGMAWSPLRMASMDVAVVVDLSFRKQDG